MARKTYRCEIRWNTDTGIKVDVRQLYARWDTGVLEVQGTHDDPNFKGARTLFPPHSYTSATIFDDEGDAE